MKTTYDDLEEEIRTSNRIQRNIDDLNNEMAGRETGRQSRFGHESDKQSLEAQKRRAKQALQDFMLTAEYQAAFNSAIKTLNETRIAVYDALMDSKETLHQVKAAHETLLENVSTFNGERVYLDDDGSAYREDGSKLTEEEFFNVGWKENSPSWQTYQESRDTLDAAQERVDTLIRYSHRVDEIDAELHDQDNRPVQNRVEKLENELHTIRDVSSKNHDIEHTYAPKEASINLPSIGM